jgi:hypothetical protein
MTDFELGYCLGLITGEGYFHHDKQGYGTHLDVKLKENDPEPLRYLLTHMGGKTYGPYESGGRRFLIWRLNSHELAGILDLMVERMPPSRKRDQLLRFQSAHWSAVQGYQRGRQGRLRETKQK